MMIYLYEDLNINHKIIPYIAITFENKNINLLETNLKHNARELRIVHRRYSLFQYAESCLRALSTICGSFLRTEACCWNGKVARLPKGVLG